MNDGHPSGAYSPVTSSADASYGYYPADYSQGGVNSGWSTQSPLSTGDDPLFGSFPGSHDSTCYGQAYAPATESATGYADHSAYPGHPAAAYPDALGTIHDTGTVASFGAPAPVDAYGTGAYAAGQYDTTAVYGVMDPGSTAHGAVGYEENPGYGYDTGVTACVDTVTGQPSYTAYDGYPEQQSWDDPACSPAGLQATQDPQAVFGEEPGPPEGPGADPGDVYTYDYDGEHDEPDDHLGTDGAEGTAEEPVPAPRSRARRAGSGHAQLRARRRKPAARRSALFTVAVPSVAVMGVAAVAAAVVSPDTDKGDKSGSQTDRVKTVANTKLDRQLASLTVGADDFADRASRTQERIDLKERQAAEKRRKELEAARKEALRPKFVIPVKQHVLSARFGQAGVNWMSLHTGIDFPVGYGTPVMAATDGVVSTKWGGAYGNMAIVTHADGTETWYCHLSSVKIRTGPVKAGDVIAYSGNSGNSTGPHLHFEVHPGGGAAVDPIPWLLSKGLSIG